MRRNVAELWVVSSIMMSMVSSTGILVKREVTPKEVERTLLEGVARVLSPGGSRKAEEEFIHRTAPS